MAVVMITGCSRPTGFGQRTALAFAKAGHEAYATMRKPERGASLEKQAAAAGLKLRVIEQDVTDPASNRRAVEVALERSGRIDVLINNAAVSAFGALETVSDEKYRSVLETNFFGSVDATRAVLPAMRKQGSGRVLFVTSLAGCIGLPGETAYSASKFAVEGMAEGLSYEVKHFGIDVSIVAPSFFDTGMSADTNVEGHFETGTTYDAFNEHIVAATTAGEDSGEDPELVAAMILEAATTDEPRLRWWPGEQGPGLAAARRAMTDADWQPMLTGEMKLGWWVGGQKPA
ncbi:MAG: SDR family oxidoreductase [Deltaproteobacteria bacterium]|nr:SDR family oxidoreductase [Deltaproteobacteria bacterium]